MLTTANASAPKNRGISQCQQDRNDMREAHKTCLCKVGNIASDWSKHWHHCAFWMEGSRIEARKAKVWKHFGEGRVA